MPLEKPTKPDAITAVPTPVPLRTDRANFAARGDAMMGWFPTGIAGVNTTLTYFGDAVNFVEQEANEAEASATAAAASNVAAGVNAAAAAASAGAILWVTGSTYTAGVVRYSPTNFQTYRDTVGGLSSTDPASDTTGRWQSAMLPSAEAIALPDLLPTAYFNFAGGVIDRRFVPSRATPTTRYNIFGNLESVPAGIALPDFDPLTKRCLGYRSSPAATYLAMRSIEMDNAAYWARTNVTVTPAARIGIDGAMSMFKLEAPATNSVNFNRSVVATASTQYVSIRVAKGNTASSFNTFGAYNITTASGINYFTVNYDTGVVTHSLGSGATATPVGNDILEIRFSISLTIGQVANFYCGGNGGAGTTAGNYFYASHIDVSDKPNAPYYPTAGSNFSRGADKLALDLTAHTAIINPQGFTIVCAFKTTAYDGHLVGTRVIMEINDGTNANRMTLYISGSSLTLSHTYGNVVVGTFYFTKVPGRQVFAFSYDGASIRAVCSGQASQSISTGAAGTLANLFVGTLTSTGYELNDPIELIVPFPRACTAGELRAFVNNY